MADAAQKNGLIPVKFALAGIETFRTIRKDQFEDSEAKLINEIAVIARLFPVVGGTASDSEDRNSP